MILLIFGLLSIIYAVEVLTSLARGSGYAVNIREAGFVLQSSIALFSRVFVFLLMPMIGFVGDTAVEFTISKVVLSFTILIAWIPLITLVFRGQILIFFCGVVRNLQQTGSLFQAFTMKAPGNERVKVPSKPSKKLNKQLKTFYIFYFLSYVPFYLAWPIIIIIMISFPDYRATV
ncbi:hypothetical protein N8128_06205, partial [Paracoccaceae bacterium]|nr:hypothetical protein [Paracoccaceae bacterium]